MAQSLGLIAYQQAQEDPIPIPTLDQTKDIYNSAKDAVTNLVGGNLGAAAKAGLKAAEQASDAMTALMSYRPIGAAYGFRVTQARTNRVRRGINSPMEGFAVTPGPVTTTIIIERAVLYEEDAMQAFNFAPGNIAFQTRPLCIIELVSKPGQEDKLMNLMTGHVGQKGLGVLSSIVDLASMPVYTSCWISESQVSYKLTENQLVIQEITMNVARISPAAATALSVLGLPGEQTLIEKLPLAKNINSLASGSLTKYLKTRK